MCQLLPMFSNHFLGTINIYILIVNIHLFLLPSLRAGKNLIDLEHNTKSRWQSKRQRLCSILGSLTFLPHLWFKPRSLNSISWTSVVKRIHLFRLSRHFTVKFYCILKPTNFWQNFWNKLLPFTSFLLKATKAPWLGRLARWYCKDEGTRLSITSLYIRILVWRQISLNCNSWHFYKTGCVHWACASLNT